MWHKFRPSSSDFQQVAAFETCDPNFFIYRKFNWLHSRVLLRHQNELVILEQELERLDAAHYKNDPQKLTSRRRDEGLGHKRKELLENIEQKLSGYDELLLRVKEIHSIQQPTKRNQNSLYNLIHSSESLAQSESEWVYYLDDLAALANDFERGWFNGFVEDTMKRISRTATNVCFQFTIQFIKDLLIRTVHILYEKTAHQIRTRNNRLAIARALQRFCLLDIDHSGNCTIARSCLHSLRDQR